MLGKERHHGRNATAAVAPPGVALPKRPDGRGQRGDTHHIDHRGASQGSPFAKTHQVLGETKQTFLLFAHQNFENDQKRDLGRAIFKTYNLYETNTCLILGHFDHLARINHFGQVTAAQLALTGVAIIC